MIVFAAEVLNTPFGPDFWAIPIPIFFACLDYHNERIEEQIREMKEQSERAKRRRG